MGVEPINDRITCHPPVLKTGTITGPHALPFQIKCHELIGISTLAAQFVGAQIPTIRGIRFGSGQITSVGAPFAGMASPF